MKNNFNNMKTYTIINMHLYYLYKPNTVRLIKLSEQIICFVFTCILQIQLKINTKFNIKIIKHMYESVH